MHEMCRNKNKPKCTIQFNGSNALRKENSTELSAIFSALQSSSSVNRNFLVWEIGSRNSSKMLFPFSQLSRLAPSVISHIVRWQLEKSFRKLFLLLSRGVLWHLKHSVPLRHQQGKRIKEWKRSSVCSPACLSHMLYLLFFVFLSS